MKKKNRETMISLLGEGFHTAFRKVPVKNSDKIHELIRKLDDESWHAILDFVLDGIEWTINEQRLDEETKRWSK